MTLRTALIVQDTRTTRFVVCIKSASHARQVNHPAQQIAVDATLENFSGKQITKFYAKTAPKDIFQMIETCRIVQNAQRAGTGKKTPHSSSVRHANGEPYKIKKLRETKPRANLVTQGNIPRSTMPMVPYLAITALLGAGVK